MDAESKGEILINDIWIRRFWETRMFLGQSSLDGEILREFLAEFLPQIEEESSRLPQLAEFALEENLGQVTQSRLGSDRLGGQPVMKLPFAGRCPPIYSSIRTLWGQLGLTLEQALLFHALQARVDLTQLRPPEVPEGLVKHFLQVVPRLWIAQ